MPRKKPGMTPEEQSEAFKREAQRLIDVGELNPTDAEAAVDKVVRASRSPKRTDDGLVNIKSDR
jgi:hypothetical protein